MLVDFEPRGNIALITIRRPEARNAVNAAVAQGLEASIDRLEADDRLWVGVLAGEGRAFSAGADLKEIDAGNLDSLFTERGGFAGITRRSRTKPIIAAVDAPAFAGGCEIVLSCDMVVAGASARFGVPEVKRSLVAGAGALFRLADALPRHIAMEMLLTGDPIDAHRAAALGFVNELVPEGTAVEAALALAAKVCANAPIAVRESRRVLIAATGPDEQRGWDLTSEAMDRVMSTEDCREGPRAFIEKRPPVWVAR